MKNSPKLLSYRFEKLNISFPSFPTERGTLNIMGARGYIKFYHSKKRKNVSAMKWEIILETARVKGKKIEFTFNAVMVGEFDHGFAIRHSQIPKLLGTKGIQILLDILVSSTETIMNNSVFKVNPLPAIRLKNLRLSRKPLHTRYLLKM
ncbi:MAG: hypothetical protein ACRDGA_07850 [Bacteroidota bacterium]